MDEAKLFSERLSGIDDLKSLLAGRFVHAPISFQIYSADGHSLAVNPTFLKLFGSAPPPEYDVFADDILERQGVTGLIRRAFAGETIVLPPIWYDPRELRQVEVREGRRVGIQVTMFPLRDGAGVVRHVALCAQDVTPQLELGMREESLRLAFSAGRMIAWDTNLTARTVHVSDNAREVLGLRSDTPLVTIDDTLALVHVEDRAAVAHALAVAHDGGGSPDRRFRVVRPLDGELRWFERRGQVSLDATTGSRWLRGILIDVTARVQAEGALRASEEALRRAEEQLRQSQKIEAIGRLAGGIAHDFNNILSVILSYGDLLLADLPADDGRRPDEHWRSRRAGERAAEFHDAAARVRPAAGHGASRVLDLNDAVFEHEQMMRRPCSRETIEYRRAPRGARGVDPAPTPVQLDQVDHEPRSIQRARRHAPRAASSRSRLAHVCPRRGAIAREHLGVVPGPHVMLAVSDTGHGADRAKSSGARLRGVLHDEGARQGTGLGLSTVLGSCRRAAASGSTSRGRGRRSRSSSRAPRPTSRRCCRGGAATPRGSETVLLVEDQEEVRRVACEILSRYGYRVVEAASAQEALDAWERPAPPFDLLLTDVVMPAMSGREARRSPRPRVPTCACCSCRVTPRTRSCTTASSNRASPICRSRSSPRRWRARCARSSTRPRRAAAGRDRAAPRGRPSSRKARGHSAGQVESVVSSTSSIANVSGGKAVVQSPPLPATPKVRTSGRPARFGCRHARACVQSVAAGSATTAESALMVTLRPAYVMALVLYQNVSAGPAVPTGAGTVTLPMRPAPGHADEMESSAATSPECAKVGSTSSSTRALGSSSYCWSDQNGVLVGARAACSKPGSNRLAFAVRAGS